MYVDFNGKRIDLGKRFVAALVTVAIVGGAIALWQMWPRQRVVYVNVPVQVPVQQPRYQAPVQQSFKCGANDSGIVVDGVCQPAPGVAAYALCPAGMRWVGPKIGCAMQQTGSPPSSTDCSPPYRQTSLGCLDTSALDK
jgi:hypothetical protein